MAIEGIGAEGLPRLAPLPKSTATETKGVQPSGFAGELSKFVHGVNADQVDAAQKIKDLAVDGKGSIHETMVAVSNAEGSFRLLMEVRNRLIEGVNRLLQSPN